MNLNPSYVRLNKPLAIEYHGAMESLRLSNTGIFWDVKLPYQLSMNTALYGAQYPNTTRFRLDRFHSHWGSDDRFGSEHSVDGRTYAAELHFVHYNMEKYRTLAKAARHPDGLVVLAVFLDANQSYHNHAELDKIVNNLKNVTLKGQQTIIKQAIRIDNLMPSNKSYWSYQGSLTTSPFYESVTWFVFKQPIKCNSSQLQKFRSLNSTLRIDDEAPIISNIRSTQPLNGRTIYTYDDNFHHGR